MSAEREGLREATVERLAKIMWAIPVLPDKIESIAKAFGSGTISDPDALWAQKGNALEVSERSKEQCRESARALLSLLPQAQEPVAWMVQARLPETCAEDEWPFGIIVESEGSVRSEMSGYKVRGYEARVIPLVPVGASPVASAPEEKLADVAGRMKAYGYDAETLRVLTDHILGGAEIPMPSAPEPYDASKEPIALNFLDNILDCWKMGGDALDRFMRAQRRQIEDVLASAPVWPEPGAPAPATKPPLGKIRPSAPEEEREARVLEIRADTCDRLVEALCTISAPDSYAEEYGQHAGAHYMDGVSVCIREIQRLSPRATQREGGEDDG